jgi:predicted TIM-barrel fold metal-dependent hydrolase
MHVVGDLETYPLHASAQYIPHPHLLPQALTSIYAAVAIPNIVFVQPSIYGNDNSCLLDALRELGPLRGRGVVTFDPETITSETLQEWHELGVRGVRLNFKSVGKAVDGAELRAELQKYADIIRPFGWALQLWIGLEDVHILEPIVPELGVKVCLDHFGGPSIPSSFTTLKHMDPYILPGFQSLINLLHGGHTYVKLSAPYRLTNDAVGQRDIEPLAKEILRVAGKKYVVFATDWPHTRFDGVNITPFAEKCLEWCDGDEELKERFFRGNAEDLWDVKP